METGTGQTTATRFAALLFDAEAPELSARTNSVLSVLLLIPGLGLLGQVVWWLVIDGEPLWGVKVLATLALVSLWFWILWRAFTESRKDTSRFLAVGDDRIDVHLPPWYETSVPFEAIDRIEHRERNSLRDMIAESFCFRGRVPERGQHIAIFCNRRIGMHSKFTPFDFRKTFRAKLAEPQTFLALANQRLDRWQMEHPTAARAHRAP
jgi:hypothetical protein